MGTSLLVWYLFLLERSSSLASSFLTFCLSRWEVRSSPVCLHVPPYDTQCCVYRGHPVNATGSQVAEYDQVDFYGRTVPREPRARLPPLGFPGTMAGGEGLWQHALESLQTWPGSHWSLHQTLPTSLKYFDGSDYAGNGS